jgi:hypothetical protein
MTKWVLLLSAMWISFAQAPAPSPEPAPVEFSCPMDPDIRSKSPGKCSRCGMPLEPRIQEPMRYTMRVKATPPQMPAGRDVRLEFRITEPKSGAAVKDYKVVHEKLFHLFVVSEDLQYFAHEHPIAKPDGSFDFTARFPAPGHYALLADVYPADGTPQLLSKIVTTAGYMKSLQESVTQPARDLSPKQGENLKVELTIEPAQPIAGKKTLLFFHLSPADGFEQYLGAWGHMLVASNDLIDLIHDHPTYVTQPDGLPQVQFDVFFPREAVYRLWVQFQRNGIVNTVTFTIPVTGLR